MLTLIVLIDKYKPIIIVNKRIRNGRGIEVIFIR